MNNKKDLLRFKYGVSRGQNSYGYRIVSLLVNGKKEYSTCGGGYDMRGTVFGQYLMKYKDRLEKLPAHYGSLDANIGFYGLVHSEGMKRVHKATKTSHTFLDGACGMSEMLKIAKTIGLEVEYLEEDILLVIDTK